MNRFQILKLKNNYKQHFELIEPPKISNFIKMPTVQRVNFPLFEVSTNPQIPLTQITERRFNLIERAQSIYGSTSMQGPAEPPRLRGRSELITYIDDDTFNSQAEAIRAEVDQNILNQMNQMARRGRADLT